MQECGMVEGQLGISHAISQKDRSIMIYIHGIKHTPLEENAVLSECVDIH
jgi:hypothetical protein